jgi:predicted glutamine amidotransferase
MCRLFAMSGGAEPLSARFWLLDAPDSLTVQSHREPDGTGLGTFDSQGQPVVHKAPISAFSDSDFAHEARTERSTTFLAHIRFASTGGLTWSNTHPFEQEGRLCAHNGVLGDLPRLEHELGDDLALVKGETDSERLFALITRETRRRNGDLHAGITTAVTWVAEHLPVYSLNLILTTPTALFALRYPDTHTLYVLDRAAGGQPLHHRSSLGTTVHADDAAERHVIVLASEPMDGDREWRPLKPGELLHIGPELKPSSTIPLPDPPSKRLTLQGLNQQERASQATSPSAAMGTRPAFESPQHVDR